MVATEAGIDQHLSGEIHLAAQGVGCGGGKVPARAVAAQKQSAGPGPRGICRGRDGIVKCGGGCVCSGLSR